MALDILYQNELFESYTQGQKSKLPEILDIEKSYLYDFLIRMTGDQNRSISVVEQVLNQMLNSEEVWQQLNKLRLALYLKARNLMIKVWNADVTKLEHPSLIHVLRNPESDRKALKRAKAYSHLNQAISTCEGHGREIVILHLRIKFTFSEIAQVMGHSRDFVEEHYGKAIKLIKNNVPNLPPDPRKAISNLDVYPFPQVNDADATDLSGLIGGIERDRQMDVLKTSFYGFLVAAVFSLCIVIIVLLLNPKLSNALTHWLKSKLEILKILLHSL
ncbi:MAG: hypothetical protein AB8G05_05080 [Oligoflexales bacterium]